MSASARITILRELTPLAMSAQNFLTLRRDVIVRPSTHQKFTPKLSQILHRKPIGPFRRVFISFRIS
jgi:hypothetical protein